MRLARKILFIIFCCFLGFLESNAQLEVTATLDSTQMLIGDQMNIRLDVSIQNGTKLISADFSALEKAEGLEIVNSKNQWDTITSPQLIFLNKDITITIFDNGTFLIPPIPFTYSQNGQEKVAKTNELVLQVEAPTVAVNDSLSIAPIKPIIEEPMTFEDVAPLLLIFLIIGIVGGLIYYLYKRAQNKTKPVVVEPVVIRPAHEIAFEKLQLLKGKGLWEKGEVKAYQSELTFIVREYLENRYAINALESTTHEILTDLKPINLSEDWKNKLREMLQLADLVKFAKASPPEEAHARLMGYAESFVESTKLIVVDEPATEE